MTERGAGCWESRLSGSARGRVATRTTGEIMWHRRETKRPTENTNIALPSGECPVYSKPRILLTRVQTGSGEWPSSDRMDRALGRLHMSLSPLGSDWDKGTSRAKATLCHPGRLGSSDDHVITRRLLTRTTPASLCLGSFIYHAPRLGWATWRRLQR